MIGDKDRFAKIVPSERTVLQALEKQLGKQFNLVHEVKVYEVTYGTQMVFSVENNRITGISLFNCGVSDLPESIGNLSSLKKLDLSNNKLTILPESIGQLSSLQTLSLNRNKLSTLPKSIGKLSSLKELYLSYNKLSTLPESIGNLTSLERLSLYYNKLTILPGSIGNLIYLETLNLKNNFKLKALPVSIINMKILKHFFLSTTLLDKNAKSVLKQLKNRGVDVSKSKFFLYLFLLSFFIIIVIIIVIIP